MSFSQSTKPAKTHFDFILTGCGAAGLMLAYRMSQDSFFDKKSILLIDSVKRSTDDKTWCFWEEGNGEWDHLLTKTWQNIHFESKEFKKISGVKPYKYKMIRSSDFYNFVWNSLEKKDNFTFNQHSVDSIVSKKDHVEVVAKNNQYVSKIVFNSAFLDDEYKNQTKYPVLQQHFLGWFIETEEDCFDDDVATFMDFNIEQKSSTRFIYVLPTSKKTALVEYTLFSENLIEKEAYERGIVDYLNKRGIKKYKISEVEKGSIPMTCFPFWKKNQHNVLHIGTVGGWTKPSTGFTFKTTSIETKRLVSFVKTRLDMRAFRKKTRFWFYDLILLDVLSKENSKGASYFSKLFKRNSIQTILCFLDEKSSLLTDFRIILAMPFFKFTKTLFRRIL